MKTKTLKLAATLIIPTTMLALTGCKSPPANPLATQTSPSLAGGFPVVETFTEKMVVTSISPAERTVALRTEEGNTITCKAAPQVANYSQLQAGEKVKATFTDALSIFMVKNGPPPDAGAGVEVTSSAEGGQPASVRLATTDTRAKVFQLDRSYLMLKLEYGDGSKKEFKIPLPNTLENVQKGDEVLVRATEPLALCVEPR